jgi:hypothetical protein
MVNSRTSFWEHESKPESIQSTGIFMISLTQTRKPMKGEFLFNLLNPNQFIKFQLLDLTP